MATSPVLPTGKIPHLASRRPTALRDFEGPEGRYGSIATDEVEVTRFRISASRLKADNLHTISASPLSASTGREQVQHYEARIIRSPRQRGREVTAGLRCRAPWRFLG